IPDLGKRQMSDPGGGRLPPELAPLRPGALASRLTGERFLDHRVERAVRLGFAEAILDHLVGQVLVVTHLRVLPGRQCTITGSAAEAARCVSPCSAIGARGPR